MKKKELINRHILLPKWMDEKLQKIAEEKDMKITAIIRQALKEYLKKT